MNAELKGHTTDSQHKMSKYRKSYKDIASELNVQRNEIILKETELFQQKKRGDLAEAEIRKVTI